MISTMMQLKNTHKTLFFITLLHSLLSATLATNPAARPSAPRAPVSEGLAWFYTLNRQVVYPPVPWFLWQSLLTTSTIVTRLYASTQLDNSVVPLISWPVFPLVAPPSSIRSRIEAMYKIHLRMRIPESIKHVMSIVNGRIVSRTAGMCIECTPISTTMPMALPWTML